MSLTAGVISVVSTGSTVASLTATAASGGTGPYIEQWYRSVVSGFSPGAGNLIAGATSLTLNDTGLTPGTLYYYKVVYTDTGASNVTVTATQVSTTTTGPQLNPNQFAETSLLGSLDLQLNFNTVSVQVDSTQATPITFGTAVKIVDSATGGAPTVVACTAVTDEVMGFVNFNIKNTQFVAGNFAEISLSGNVIYLYATAAISRGAQVCLDLTTVGGVGPLVTASNIVGWAYDKATAPGQLIRVYLKSPSFAFAP